MADYDIGQAFKEIEEELIASMIRNLERHKAWEEDEGFQWDQWQVLQLQSLERYRRLNRKKFKGQFEKISRAVDDAIRAAREDGRSAAEAEILQKIKDGFADYHKASSSMSRDFFRLNERKLNALISATQKDFTKAEHAILRMANDQYRKVIYSAQVYANSGAGTYEKAIDMATRDFLRAGLNCVEYKNGARHTLHDYADMAIRTATTRAYLAGEGEMRNEWGIHTVIVNKRTAACSKCMPFAGKIMIDDVYANGSRKDGPYTLVSTAIEKGFLHPRCKDTYSTYFPGLDDDKAGEPSKADKKKAAEKEEAEAKQNHAELQAEKYERMAENSLDPENQKKYEARAEEWKAEAGKVDELTARRKERLAARRKAEQKPAIEFDDRVSEQQKELLQSLAEEYKTRLERVTVGAEKSAGDVDVSGSRMRLSDKHANTAIHEFAHTLANTNADKFGLTHDQEFWKEIRSIRKKYMKDVEAESSRWISTYEHSGRSLDEFMAEAFTHAKMRELGLDIPEKYGSDFTYSQQVLDVVNKYFGKDSGLSETGRLARAAQLASEKEALREMLQNSVTIGKPYVEPKEIQSAAFSRKFSKLTDDSRINDRIRALAQGNLTKNNGTYTEMLDIIDLDTGNSVIHKIGKKNALEINLTPEERAVVQAYKGRIVGIHNHPTNIFPTGSDFVAAGSRGYDFGVVITHDLRLFKYTGPKVIVRPIAIDTVIDKYVKFAYTEIDKRKAFTSAMQELERRFGITWEEVM